MRLIFFSILLILVCASIFGCMVKSFYSTSQPINHDKWSELLRKHVNHDGWLDYQGIQRDTDRFNEYLDLLENNHPNPNTWSKDERMAYWINAYNAFTVKLILDYYPVESIKDIKKGIPFVNSVWDIEFIEIEGQSYSLNNIEHGILRPKFNEPRIHFAINCASYSCPVLRREAFEANRLDLQLKDATQTFLFDGERNRLDEFQPKLSKIFSWFKGDFTKNGSLIEYINLHTPNPIDSEAKIEYIDYDWRLNDSAILK